MNDIAHRETDAEIKRIEKELRKEYQKAIKDLEKKTEDYFSRFEKKDATWQEWVQNGTKTQAQYKAWRTQQMAVGQRWEAMRHAVAVDLANVDQTAREIIQGHAPIVYAENFNFETYQIEHESGLDTDFTLYSREAVARVAREHPKMFPRITDQAKEDWLYRNDIAYNERRMQSVIMQGIIQGESIPHLAKRMCRDVGESDYKRAIRAARTAMTGAQNAGRIDAMHRAQDIGINVQKCWIATHDGRTRHWHADLDGETVPVDQPFVNDYGEIMYPGDTAADPANVWNCRCTLIQQIKGYEINTRAYRDWNLKDMTYEEWKSDKRKAYSDPIDKQAQIEKHMRAYYIAQYRRNH